MRKLQITLFIIALLFASTQTFRHIYVKWLEPTKSVLDKYDEKIEQEIEGSKNIEELLSLYNEAYNKVREYERNPRNAEIKQSERDYKEPYKTERKIRKSIEEWESHKLQIHKLRFYWFCGFFSLIIGSIVYIRLDKWLGIIGAITGFTEMIFWTSPTIFGIFGARFEFERLLTNKLFFSIITWFLLILTWFLLYKFQGKERR